MQLLAAQVPDIRMVLELDSRALEVPDRPVQFQES
jgi:hypothetical protein